MPPPESQPSAQAPSGQLSRWITAVLYVGAAAAWIVLSYRRPDDDVSGAEQAGQVTGSLIGTLLIALLVRLVYVKLLRRKDRVGFWSPWIFVIAAVIGLFGA